VGASALVLASALGGPGSSGVASAATSHAARAAAGPLTAFRVDVSRYPRLGMVVTVPRGGKGLTRRDFAVRVGKTWVRPRVRHLSPGDIRLALVPDTDGPAALLAAERAATAKLLVSLPQGARTAVVDPGRPTRLAGGMTGDPTASLARFAALARGAPASAAARLTGALSVFPGGPRVRRTVILVVGSGPPLAPAMARRLSRQLAAGGTALYVLDASRHGMPGYAALATGSGGFAARPTTPHDWEAAYTRIVASLTEQYYLRFPDPAGLPGTARIIVATHAGDVHGLVHLPVANPVAPSPVPPEFQVGRPIRDWPLVWLGVLLIALILCYGLGMLGASRREPHRVPATRHRATPAGSAHPCFPDDLFFVFLLPCLNEERVILKSLQRLLSMPGGNFAVLVVDDGSDDGTAAVVSTVLGERVWLLRRTAPHARQGKGEALNAAIRHLTGNQMIGDRDPANVIIVVVDADGRLDTHAITEVSPYFADRRVGAVQIGVRINNRATSRLARMQDMEFVIYTEVFQRGRRHLGSVGLGGNGQFMRLSALRSLGPGPWSQSLTEDLDLGIRLLAAGWRNEYCPTAAVHQQGVVRLTRLIRQRSRWFQGHLQSWKLIPTILRSAPPRARADLLYHVSSPAILLIASLLSASFVLALTDYVILALHGQRLFGWWLASTYGLTFGPGLMFSSVYWTRERENGVPLIKVAGFAHLYICYSLMWYVAGWWAVSRTLRRRTGWAKTDRVVEASAAPVPAGSRPAAGGRLDGGRLDGGRLHGGRLHGGRLHGGRRGARAITLVGVAVLACVAARTLTWTSDRAPSPWFPVFNGFGTTAVTGSGSQQVITLSPARARTWRSTHAALVLSTSWYRDFVATTDVSTVRQLRSGAAGRPNPWEVGWVIWDYTSNRRFYALTLEPTGWVLSKQDPAYPGGERFLASATFPRFGVGVRHRVGIVQIGDQMTIFADGDRLTRFTDKHQPYRSGGFGFYCEDSLARFAHVQLSPLPGMPGRTTRAGRTPGPRDTNRPGSAVR
jgi:cellulose synthase/poly-beta-1,6-N-acetylglucosamine synthase-like glycosyltransferase